MARWQHAVVARNDATDSENRIHSDDVARRYGFRGGLVPGVTVYTYMVGPVVDAWGRDWLESGSMRARFGAPVYDGDTVTATAEQTGDGSLQLELRDSGGAVCATGSAALGSGDEAVVPVDVSHFPAVARPARDARPPASPETFAEWPMLGEVEFIIDTAAAGASTAIDGVANPGWLLRWANYALSGTVKLGPWIHVESDVQHLALGWNHEAMSVRARVEDVFERRGHRFVVLDVLWLSTGEHPVMRARHTAIYEPRVGDAAS